MIPLLAALLLAAPLRPAVTLPLLTVPPVIDGVIHEAEWSGAVRNVGLVAGSTGRLDTREATTWVGCDGQTLYLALLSEAAPDGLLTRAVPAGDFDQVAVVRDDSVELVIHPHLGAAAGRRTYYHLIVNARGAMFDRAIREDNPAQPIDAGWRLHGWTFKQQVIDGWWHVEMAIPLTSLDATAEDLTRPWGLRLCRNWQRPGDQSRWESTLTAYEDLPTMPRVTFAAGAPVVQVRGLRQDGRPHLVVALRNPGPAAVTAQVDLADTWSRNPPTERAETVTLPPGGEQTVTFDPPAGGPEGAHRTVIRVASPDGATVYYQREFTWLLARPAQVWSVGEAERQAIGLQYAVYPSYGQVRARVDVAGLAAKDQVTGGELSFGPVGGAALVKGPVVFANFVAERQLAIPDLPAGKYEVRVTLTGGPGVPREPVTGVYERRVFAWEHNQLGRSDILVTGFTPIQVQGQRLSTVLRHHDLGADGLWQQVTSLDRPLLTGPMRWTVVHQGQPQPIAPTGFRVLSHKPTGAVTLGGFVAGSAKAEVRSTWDYDGLARITVRLSGLPGATVDRVGFEVPLDDRQMPYLHTCGDGLRFNYAGRTPAGDGVVWDSSKGNRTDIRSPFYPYLWVGGGERGFVFCADNDRGWSLDDKTPTLVLERRGGTLWLRVSLITKRTRLDRARELEFGLMATPAKPLPAQPVDSRRWLGTSFPDQPVQPFTVMGSNPYYGQVSYDLWPVDQDQSIYAAFSKARDTGQVDAAFVKQWLTRYRRFLPPDSPRWEFFTRHVDAGMRMSAGTPRAQHWLLTPYTNPRGMGFDQPEWPTFQDEWLNFPYFQRAASGEVSYEVTPTASFRDAAMASYRAMMTCFDGIYWDNLYLSANNNPVAGGAVVDDDGQLHPSFGLWDMRELVRRTAVLFCESGRPVYSNVVHMTNACLVPVLSFATVNLDWEWQYGNRDFQDRFSPELTVAETIGRQCGNIPLILPGGLSTTEPKEVDWILRTRTGVCLVHELRLWDWRPKAMWDLYHKLYAFGYGTPACQVFNYWDDGFPASITGVEAKAIVLLNGRRAVVGVTDYGQGGAARVKLDLARLGLPAALRAKDVETDEPVPIAGGELAFPLRKHDYRVVLVEPQPTDDRLR